MATLQNNHPLHIILADDGSEHAQAAVTLLTTLPLPPESLVTALRVFTPLQASEHATLQAALDRTQASFTEKGIRAETELLLGYPAEKVIEYADQHRPDLVVLGAKGLRATLGILLGGVAQQVIEYAQWPVLVLRAPFKGLNCVLLAIDGSSYSHQAAEYLCQSGKFARLPLPVSTEVHVINVLPPTPVLLPLAEPGTGMMMPVQTEEITAYQAEEEQQGQALLEPILEGLKACGVKANGTLLRGDAATEIMDYARRHQADLIVVGSRGLSEVKSWLMGSVSRKLVHYSGCSVLVARGPHP